jgi:hypothetical protein
MGEIILFSYRKTNEFIIKANKKHNNRYNYSKVNYINNYNKVVIICNEHGEFEQVPSSHVFGQGCPKCGRKRTTQNDFIIKSNKIHNNKYDYSKVNYINSSEKVIIICDEHGEFEQRPNQHLIKKQGCPKCGTLKQIENNTFTTEEYIIKAQEIHNNTYDYSKLIYTQAIKKVDIICKEHGLFEQRACNHLLGAGCPKCMNLKSQEDFITQANQIHNNLYDYSKTEYKHSEQKIIIICDKHGEFEQQANSHLNGYGCPKCSYEKTISNSEKEIGEFIQSLGINFNISNREIINGFELDIYIPEKQLAIEYNGLYWHNEINKPNKNYHLQKTIECEKQGIQLIQIFEDEWIEKELIIKSRLKNLFGFNQKKIFARKCIIQEVSIQDTKDFLINNHIQGFVGSNYSYGLYYHDSNTDKVTLVSLMTFGSLRKNLGSSNNENEHELLRFCNDSNTSVIGGASKLFSHFIRKHNPSKIISYADRRWSQGKLYEKIGFKFLRNSVPNYFYVIGTKRKNRFNFRKDILISKYGCLPSDTEHNFCFNQKWYRIYDCGTKVYEWNKII